ncbi:hypothetical protein MMC13_007227 [Lambiella insularis]|nr:hypothetical protein [Lambiella insularis]
MTRTVQRQSPSQDTGPGLAADLPETHKMHTVNLHPVGDYASDGDTGERPVREKLKKTSIASLPKFCAVPAEVGTAEHPDTVMGSHEVAEEALQAIQNEDTNSKERGRPPGKRALEDPDAVETEKDGPIDTSFAARHARKRSRDIRSVEDKKSGSRRRSTETPVQEETEDMESPKEDTALRHNLEDTSIKEHPVQTTTETVDQEMQESILSPKKKRSRDQFESESQREQKIAATDVNRARHVNQVRRSTDEDIPATTELDTGKTKTREESDKRDDAVPHKEISNEDLIEEPKATISPEGGFANVPAASPFHTFARTTSPPAGLSMFGKKTSNQETQTSSSAFASSGFAALASSSQSPFSTVGAPPSKTRSPAPPSPSRDTRSPFATTVMTETSSLGGFGGSVPGGFGATGKSSFASVGASGFAALGGSTFGTGFSSGFGGGPKLSSFAAPTGDAKLGDTKAKPFGASEDSDDEESGSEGGDDHNGELAEESEDTYHKLQHQEVDTGEQGEDTIFSNRGKLYHFHQGVWKERGTGLFKLNVKQRSGEDDLGNAAPVEARFIMRTHATYKVILNSPIFKNMTVDNGRGKIPNGKLIAFAVFVDDKLTPHSLTMSKEEDVKTLYREITRLQNQM